MDSFEELGLAAELVEALACEGIERPTPLQEGAIPVIRRGHNLVATAGPGAGVLVTYGAGILDRIVAETQTPGPQALVLVPFAEAARRLAESLSRLCALTGHTVAALGSHWALPERAQILFASPRDLLDRVERSAIDLAHVQAIVVDGAATIHSVMGLDLVATVLDSAPAEAQRVLVSLPLTEAVEDFAERHVRRSVHVPARRVGEAESGPRRGLVGYRVVPEPTSEGVLQLVAELLVDEAARHVALFVRNEDRAADLGDYLTQHGFLAGAPGEETSPVWLAVEELAALPALEEGDGVVVVSADVPAGPDALDRRHGGGRGGYVLVLGRELGHFRDVAARTGFEVEARPPPGEDRVADDLVETVESIEAALGEEDIAAYLLVLESLFQEYDPAEVAAAAAALLRKKTKGASPKPHRPAVTEAMAWARLYVSLGRKDDAGPGDIVGAIAGEAGLEASRIGKIELRDSFSIVEVESSVADQVIKALNGVTVRGRSVRVDYDRGSRRGGAQGSGRASRKPASGPARRRPPSN